MLFKNLSEPFPAWDPLIYVDFTVSNARRLGEGQDAHYNLSLNGDSCIITREMDKIIIRWQEYIFIILSRSESRIHVRIFPLSGCLAQVFQAYDYSFLHLFVHVVV